MTADEIVAALAAVDPLYDHGPCLFCGSFPPTAEAAKGPNWSADLDPFAEGEPHEGSCVYGAARQLLSLPPWPVDA